MTANTLQDYVPKLKSSYSMHHLRINEPKCWNFIEWVFSSACTDDDRKERVTLFLLNKTLPNANVNLNLNADSNESINESMRSALVGSLQYLIGKTQSESEIKPLTPQISQS